MGPTQPAALSSRGHLQLTEHSESYTGRLFSTELAGPTLILVPHNWISPSMSSPGPDLDLLRKIIPPFLDVARFYSGKNARAIEARRLINEQHRREKAFHSDVWSEMRLLFETLVSLVPPVNQQEVVSERIQDLLNVLEDDFVRVTGPESLDCITHNTSWPQLEALTIALASMSDEERLELMLLRTDLRKPKRSTQKRIIESTRNCRQALEPNKRSFIESTEREIAEKLDQKDAALRFDIACVRMEQLHTSFWMCECKPSHLGSVFSFDPFDPPGNICVDDRQACLLVFPTPRSPKGWQRAEMKFASHQDLEATEPELDLALGTLCAELEKPSSKINIHGDCDPPVELGDTSTLRTAPLRERLVIALYLCHMYLHLSGGPWWPYQQTQNIVWFERSVVTGQWQLTMPYFSAPSTQPCVAPWLNRVMHKDMPSLPVLGKTLLELFTGRCIDWLGIEEAITSYAKEPFAHEIIEIINALLGTADVTMLKPGNLRENERMRMYFERTIINTLHYILAVGFHVDFSDELKRAQSNSGIVNPASVAIVGSGMTQTPTESKIPFSPATLCLHDDGEKEHLDHDDARSTLTWMSKLHTCIKNCHIGNVPDTVPVRIAVIDTGAQIHGDDLEFMFDSRLKECRSWLDSADAGDGLVMPSGGDADGHGTHTVSLALRATQNTHCELFSAQVFCTRQEQLESGNAETAQLAIARAIRYAVVTWEVDVISMSFGCNAAVPIIEHEIQNAASKGVVMFAAASNCGGNDLISWPACHDEVIPVYASRGDGNKYDRNPSPDPKSENFSVVGTSLEGSWPSQIPGARTTQHRSGTSGATPIAAGIAATILQLMRAEKSEFLQRRSPLRQDVESKYYERCITSLRTSRGMKAAFALMSPRERDGYDYVTPWSLLDGADGDNWDIVYKICEAQGKLLDQKRKGKRVRV